MSWTPDFWIKNTDLPKLKQQLIDLKNSSVKVWEFNIGSNLGYVITGGEFSSTHIEIDSILEKEKIGHWLLNSEGENCPYCNKWGKRIELSDL